MSAWASVWAPEAILTAFIVFCRVGACLMIMPGFSSARIPTQVRLFVVLGVSLALTPIVAPTLGPLVAGADLSRVVLLIVTESLVGAQIGLVGRLFFLALQTMGHAIAMFMGFGMLAGVSIDEPEPVPALTTLIMTTATALLFITDQHWEVIRGLVGSYTVMPPVDGLSARLGLVRLVDGLSAAFALCLQIAAPFLVFSFVMNLAFGITNKFIPQIPVYFLSLPIMLIGGLFVFYFLSGDMFALFSSRFGAWLIGG
ncbi:MAG: flagellar biosynthesis protein FliR [Microvirga sp.]|nr:flagellar biosynthesis protein FliR [Microvirga sp.]